MLFPEVHLELEREKVSSALCSGIWAYHFFLLLYLLISSFQFFMFLLFLRRVAFVRGPSSGGCWAPRSHHPPLLGGRSHSRASILFHLKNDPSSWYFKTQEHLEASHIVRHGEMFSSLRLHTKQKCQDLHFYSHSPCSWVLQIRPNPFTRDCKGHLGLPSAISLGNSV